MGCSGSKDEKPSETASPATTPSASSGNGSHTTAAASPKNAQAGGHHAAGAAGGAAHGHHGHGHEPKSGIVKEHASLATRYKMGEVLGEGGYSVVKQGVGIQDKNKVAIKIVTRSGLSPDDEQSLRQEVEILNGLNHPNIVRAFEFYEEDKYFYLVMEFLEGGELFDRIVKKTFYSEKEARDLVVIVLKAIKYIHDLNVIHRDLKPENLLLTSKLDDANLKLADFGFAVQVDGFSVTTQCGTPGYIAPEILESKPYGKPVDMWSFGVILYILLGGYPPFHDDNQRALFRKIVKGDYQFHPDYWNAVSEEAKDLIRGLLTLNPLERLTVDQALNHVWVKKDDNELASRSLATNLAELRKYQATRKLRAGVKAVMAINKMKRLLGSSSNGESGRDVTSAADQEQDDLEDATRI